MPPLLRALNTVVLPFTSRMKNPVYTAVLALLLATSTNAGAATKTWTGAIDNDWHEPGNWSPPGVPAGNDTINIVDASVYATPPVTLANGATLNWTCHENAPAGSLFQGGLTIASGGVLNLTGDDGGSLSFFGGVTNAGAIHWSGAGRIYLWTGSVIVNQPGGLFDAQNNGAIVCYNCLGTEAVLNAGLFRKSAGTDTTTVDPAFTNTTGTVQVESGIISFNGGGSLEGNYHAAAGAAIQVGRGVFTYSTPPTFTGPGDFQLAGATLTLVNNPIPNLQMISGTVILSPGFQGGTITNLNLGGVNLSGNHTVSGNLSGYGNLDGDLVIASGATVIRSGGTMTGTSTIASGGTLNLTNQAIYGELTVANGATLNWTCSENAPAGSLFQGGLTIASNGVLNVDLTGDGVGSLSFFGGVTNAGAIHWSGAGRIWSGAGRIYLWTGSVIVNQPGGIFDAQNDGAIVCYNCLGTEAVLNAGLFRKSAGTNTTTIDTAFTNTGTVRADTGTIAFQSAFHQSPAATLSISIGGPTPGPDYGHIRFAQPLVLDGAFTGSTRNGYLPNPGDTFSVLSYPSFTGDFTCLSGINLGGGIVLFPAMLPKGMTLTAASVSNGAPVIFATRWAGGVRLLRPPGFSDWGFVAATNLFAPVWVPVPATGCDQVTLPVTAPQQYFRLRKNN